MPGTVHVTNGDSTAATLAETGFGGEIVPWRDALHEGPILDLPPAGLRDLRAGFLASCGWGGTAEIRSGLEWRDGRLDRALAAGGRIVLWFEHDLYDQLQLVEILARVASARRETGSIELVEVGAFAGRSPFRGLGELTVAELGSLWPTRRPLTPGAISASEEAWRALCARDPRAIGALVDAPPPERPFLAPALRRLLEELPDAAGGLARSERCQLELLATRPHTALDLFESAVRLEEAPYEGDTWAWRRLARLCGGARPLARAGGGALPSPPPVGDTSTFANTVFEITGCGRQVLAGEVDLVEAIGIDRWVGGTHLLPGGLWRWDTARRRVVPG